jgi:7-cyano-7-deazaguanine synthase
MTSLETPKTKAVVLLSGGLDSTVLLASTLHAGRQVLPIAFDYGQRHRQELFAAREIQRAFRYPKGDWDVHSLKIVDLDALNTVAKGSSQLGDLPVPHGHYAEESMKATVVPNRNMTMLALATAYAISNGAAEVAYAAHAGDHTIYPDCRPAFAEVMRKAISLCDYESRTPLLVTPFISISKADIVIIGRDLSAPMHLTYSCYEGREHHCGLCGTCVERKEAFEVAGVKDPTQYYKEGV